VILINQFFISIYSDPSGFKFEGNK